MCPRKPGIAAEPRTSAASRSVKRPSRTNLASVETRRLPEGPFRYKSARAAVPLTELEEALLVGAGAGFTGPAFWDLPMPPPGERRERSKAHFGTMTVGTGAPRVTKAEYVAFVCR